MVDFLPAFHVAWSERSGLHLLLRFDVLLVLKRLLICLKLDFDILRRHLASDEKAVFEVRTDYRE